MAGRAAGRRGIPPGCGRGDSTPRAAPRRTSAAPTYATSRRAGAALPWPKHQGTAASESLRAGNFLSVRYEAVIGLEVHVQLLTRDQDLLRLPEPLRRAAQHATSARSAWACPGALPVLNRRRGGRWPSRAGARRSAARSTSASVFARKNYFYPDLPKGYQICQYDRPLADRRPRRISRSTARPRAVGLTRIHMEEDAGKLAARGLPGGAIPTGVDFNRAACR